MWKNRKKKYTIYYYFIRIFHKKPISNAVCKARISLCRDILQNGNVKFLAAISSSCPSPMTTYVLLRPNLVTILSKHDSLPK